MLFRRSLALGVIWVWAALPPQHPNRSLISEPVVSQEPSGAVVEWVPRVASHWATGGSLVLFTDGSLKHSQAAERPLQVSYWMGVGWALGLAPHASEHRLTGDDP